MAQMEAKSDLRLRMVLGTVGRYVFAVACVGIAVAVGAAVLKYTHDPQRQLLSIAIAVVTWYAGVGPAVLAVVLATACYDFFFITPIYEFTLNWQDIINLVIFAAWGTLVASFVGGRRRIEVDLRRSRDLLQVEVGRRIQQAQELEAFAHSVSHDLRAPLRHVVGFAELLQKQTAESLDDKSRRYLETILAASKRMGNLIDDLLAFSRIGRAETKKGPVNLDQLVREAVAELREETTGREIAWKIGAMPICLGDRAMLKLVLSNLLSNAVKFTRTRPRAEIEIGYTNPAKDEVEVFVRDNGVGFDMQYVDKLFGVFQRLHRMEEFEGTGIGLATVQRIVHRHGGKMRAEGATDRGATFYFSLPKL